MVRLRASRIGTPVKMNINSSYWFILLALWSFLYNNNSSSYLWNAVAYRVLLVDCRQVSTMGWELRRLEGIYSTGSGTVTNCRFFLYGSKIIGLMSFNEFHNSKLVIVVSCLLLLPHLSSILDLDLSKIINHHTLCMLC